MPDFTKAQLENLIIVKYRATYHLLISIFTVNVVGLVDGDFSSITTTLAMRRRGIKVSNLAVVREFQRNAAVAVARIHHHRRLNYC